MTKNNKIILDRHLVEKFLVEKEKTNKISGARIIELDKKINKLKAEVKETDKKLRFLL